MATGKVRTITLSYMALMLREYPEYYKEKNDQLFYEFGDGEREFRGNPTKVATAYPDP